MITVIIQPFDTLAGILGCFCQYFDKGQQKNIAILESGKVTSWKNGEKKPEEAIMYFKINSKEPVNKLVYDETSNRPQDIHLKQQHDFWLNHPDTKNMNGGKNPNADPSAKPRFLIINLDEKKSAETALIEMKAKSIVKFLGLGVIGRKRAAIFYAMPNAVTAEDGDIIIALGDLSKGLLTSEAEFSIGGKTHTYIEHFVNEYQDKSEDTDLVIAINKAIDKGIIVAQLKSGTHVLDCYLFKNSPIATSKDQLIAYMKNNRNEFEFIVNQVTSNVPAKSEGDDEAALRRKAVDLKILNQDKYNYDKLKIQVASVESGEYKKLQDEAKGLGIKFHPAISTEKLKAKIEDTKSVTV